MQQSWAILAQLAPSWGYFGTHFGPAGGYLGLLGAILRHSGGFLGPRAFWKPLARNRCASPSRIKRILEPILGPKTGPFLVIFRVIFWITFWTTFGAVLESILWSFWKPKLNQKVDPFLERLLVAIWRHFGRLLGCLEALLGGLVVQKCCKN